MDSHQPKTAPSVESIRVLHVEDNEVDALTVRMMLEKQQYASISLTWVRSLEQARLHLEKDHFDLILLDLNLPDAEDLDGLRALRPEKAETPPVIVLTGADFEEAGVLSLQAGAQDFLVKASLTGEGLARAILSAHERKRLETALCLERDRARQYLDIVPVILVALDRDCRIAMINRAGSEALGVCERSLKGMSWIEKFVPLEDRGAAQEAFEGLMQGEEARYGRMESRILGANGETPLISWRNVVMRSEDGTAAGVLSSGENVTQSERARRLVEESERAHRVIFENSPLGMIYVSARGDATRWNRKVLEIMGASDERMAGFNALRDLTDARMLEAARRAVSGEHAEFEGTYTSVTGGRTMSLKASFNPVNPGVSPTEVIAAFEDVTESRQAEENIRLMQDRLELALEAAEVGMWDWFVQSDQVLFDKRSLQIMGIDQSDLAEGASSWLSRVHPGDGPGIAEQFRRHHEGTTDIFQAEFRFKAKSGQWKWIYSKGKVVERDESNKPLRLTGMYMDIDERMRRVEELDWDEKLKDALSRLYKMLTVPDPAIETALRGLLEEARKLINVHDGFCATIDPVNGEIETHVYAGSVEKQCSVQGVKCLGLSCGEDGRYPGLWGVALNSGKAFYTNDPGAHADARGLPRGHFPLRNFLAVPVIVGNRLVGLISLANKDEGFIDRDLAAVEEMGRYYAVAIQRVEALEELSASEERYRTLVESMQEGITMIDDAGRLTYVNHQICKMLKRPRADMVGRSLTEFMDTAHRDIYLEQLGKRKQGGAEKYEIQFKDAEGRSVFALISPTPLFDEAGNYQGALSVVTNITALKILESQLVQAQKLESIGQLAAGIAHEINTPTQYVDNNVRYIKEGVESLLGIANRCQGLADAGEITAVKDGELLELAEFIRKADIEYLGREMPEAVNDALEGLERIAEIVRSVKQLAHPGRSEMELVDINEAVKSTVTVSRNEWKYSADMETEFDESLPLVSCIRGEFNQVILNLIINAAQAIQEKLGEHPEVKGRIWVSTRNTGDGVEVRVRDTGGGIPKKIQDKIFDPFFTTKEVGKGTGQGLAISHNVIREKHGGRIMVESEEGKGAVFIVWIPLKQGKTKGAAR